MKKIITSASAITAGAFLLAGAAFASGEQNCTPIYGGGQTCVTVGEVVLDKKVKHATNGLFVDNLGTNDPKFGIDQNVTFKLTITNTGDSTLDSVEVTDTLPDFLDFVSGPGNFDAGSKTLKFTINDLAANESRSFEIVAKTVNGKGFPSDRGVVCVINHARAVSEENESADQSGLCIEKEVKEVVTKGGVKVFPAPKVKETPPTGPEMVVIPALLGSGLLGQFLRKRA